MIEANLQHIDLTQFIVFNIIFSLGIIFCSIFLFIFFLKMQFLKKEIKKITITKIKEIENINLLKIRFSKEGTTLNLKNWYLCRFLNKFSKLLKDKDTLPKNKIKKFILLYYWILDFFLRYIWINKDGINLDFKFKPYLLPVEIYSLQSLEFKITEINKCLLPEEVLQVVFDFCNSFSFN